jgi:hypothetical protein
MDGWRDRGHGDFKDIRGVMVHHTGGRASAASIRDGRPDLAGPLSQLHISQTGIVSLVCAGVAWHAGSGAYPWLPTNMGNWHLIGIECEGPVTGRIGPNNQCDEKWPDAEVIALRDTCAAIMLKLGQSPRERLIGHKDYAGRAQGKWDPWCMDVTGWLAGEVEKDMRGLFGGTPPPPPPPPVVLPPAGGFAHVLLFRGMSGPDVVALQTRLKRNYSKLPIDGVFGDHTERCVRDYQATRRPPLEVDGIVGPATAASLGLRLP